MKKKILTLTAILLLAVMCVSLVSCDDKEESGGSGDPKKANESTNAQISAYEIYSDAVDKVNSLDGVHQKQIVEQKMSFSLSGQSVSSESETIVEVKTSGIGKEDMLLEDHITTSASALGQKTETVTDLFADKNNIYVKVSPATDFTTISRTSSEAETYNSILENEKMWRVSRMAKEGFDGASIAENADGSKTIKASPSKEVMKETLGDTLDQLTSYFENVGATIGEVDMDNAQVEFNVSSDGYFTYNIMKCDMSIDIEIMGYSTTVYSKVNTKIEFIDPGKPVSVVLPA